MIKRIHSHRLLTFLIASLLSGGVLAQEDTTETSAAALGLSDYRYFIIYPHLEKALRAQKHNDEKTALREFEEIRRREPNNVQLTLYQAEALRHFGHNQQASRLLSQQLKQHPDNKQLAQSLAAIPVEPVSVTSVPELLAQQQRCDEEPSVRCRSETGQNALRLGEMQIARQQLRDPVFAAHSLGEALRNDTLQRAIYLKQWDIADTLFSERFQQQRLSPAEQEQWFTVLLAARQDENLQARQSQGLFNSPENHLAYATTLVQRGETALLQRFLAQRRPAFHTAEQEKRWLYLLSRFSVHPQEALANYNAQFSENRSYIAGATLPGLLKSGHYAAARQMLAELPQDEFLQTRYELSIASHNSHETLQLAQRLYARYPHDLQRLDALSWQLIKAGQSQEAAQILLQRYPFRGDETITLRLLMRLVELLHEHPQWASDAQKTELSKPLGASVQRQLQSQLPWLVDNCSALISLLGDMSPAYDAASWSRLAACYRETLPGVALYAFQQAAAHSPDVWHHRAVAYQAYQVQDYAAAMRAWRKIPVNEMSNADLVAAANTAQAAQERDMLYRLLQEEKQRGLDNSAHYWWLHAQRYLPGEPEKALADFNRALAIGPSAQVYVSRATIYRLQGNTRAAISDLRQALTMEPQNASLQAALGYALWQDGNAVQSRVLLEQAHKAMPDDPSLIKQLAYVNQRLQNVSAAQYYARQVIDEINDDAELAPPTAEQKQQRFAFRRLHEDIARRWSFNYDSSVGLRSGTINSVNNKPNDVSPGKNYRSYGQLEAEYRVGRNQLLEGDLLSVYSRLFADTAGSGVAMPVKNPMIGTGLRWKPLRESVFFLAIEHQAPLDSHHGESDVMLRASASFFNNGRFSDEWHPTGPGWFANNLYLDAAHYVRQDIQAWTADYRVSWHEKITDGQTLEPYAHLQTNGYRNGETRGAQTGGAGIRWNIWTGETRYDAWPHKVSLGLEYQHILNSVNQRSGERNNVFVTLGVHW